MLKNSVIQLLTLLLLSLAPSGLEARDNANVGAETIQGLLQNNPDLGVPEATLQALKQLRHKPAARIGAMEAGLAEIQRRDPQSLKGAGLKIMEADPQLAGYVARTVGRLDPTLNREFMVGAARARPAFIAFAVQVACDNDPAQVRELVLAADAAVPGHSLEVLGGVMCSGCPISRPINWHFDELAKRKTIDVAAVLEEAARWAEDAKPTSLVKSAERAR